MKKLNLTTKVLSMPESGVVASTMKLIQEGCCATIYEHSNGSPLVTECNTLSCENCIYARQNLPEFTEFWRRSHPVPHNLHKL